MRKLLLTAAIVGGFLVTPVSAASAAPLPDPGVMAAASGSPPSVTTAAVVKAPIKVQTPTPLPTYRVVAGDTLWGIGIRYHRSWAALAAFNRVPNPNLIFVDQILTIPPATYTASAPLTQSAPSHTQYTYEPAKQQVRTPISHTSTAYVPPVTTPSGGSGVWGCIAQHESGGNPATNTGNGYYAAFQDTLGSWQAAGGGPGLPSDYSYSQQLAVNQRIQAQQGWGAWPNTSRMCGA